MSLKEILRRGAALVLCLLTIGFCAPFSASAHDLIDIERKGTVELSLIYDGNGIPGVTVRLYHVAEVSPKAEYTLLDPFRSTGITFPEGNYSWTEETVDHLASCTPEAGVLAEGVTDAAGNVLFSNLAPGLYLALGENTTVGEWVYTFLPGMLPVPLLDGEDQWQYTVHAELKNSRIRPSCEVTVYKFWDDRVYTGYRDQEVQVKLLRRIRNSESDFEEYETVILDSQNDWIYKWDDASSLYEYSAMELATSNITGYYQVSYSVQTDSSGNYFIEVKNKLIKPPSGLIPQTGTLWWPIWVLAGSGVVFFFLGWLLHKMWKADRKQP